MLAAQNFNFVEDHDHGGDTVERADTYQAHGDLSNLGGDGREVVPDRTVDERKTSRSLHTLFRATSLLSRKPGQVKSLLFANRTTILTQKLVHSWGKLTFASERRKVKAKQKQREIPCSSTMFPIGESPTTDERTESENRVRCLRSRRTSGLRSRKRNVSVQFVFGNPGACSSNYDTTTPLQPIGQGHDVSHSQRFQRRFWNT